MLRIQFLFYRIKVIDVGYSLNLNQTRSLGNLQPYDIIEFQSQYINRDVFMVVSIEKNDEIPAILLQLWQYSGGYNHALKNIMENDLGINQQVPFLSPIIEIGIIINIINYRSNDSGLSKKEELFFDVWPKEISENKDDYYNIPFEVEVEIESGKIEKMILPAWTPLQKLPILEVKKGTKVETWKANNTLNIMKVIEL